MEWTTALSITGRVISTGITHRNWIRKGWTIIKAWADWGNTQIVVTGHSGAGKSVLTDLLQGKGRKINYDLPEESLKTDTEAICMDNWDKLTRVLPGQKGRRVKGVLEALNDNHSLEGIIHVVDFGYSSPREKDSIDTLITKDQIDTIEKLREHNLNQEIEDLKELLFDVRKLKYQTKNKCPKWLIISVNKVDLYYDDLEICLAHYHPDGNSNFSKVLKKFQFEFGTNNFSVYVSHVCAHEVDFSWNNQKVTSQLPTVKQKQLFQSYVKTLDKISTIHK